MNSRPMPPELLPAGLLPRALLVWLIVEALVLAFQASGILGQRFPDTDDALRLVQVRDLLAGQSWFDLHQYRLDPLHGGVLMHWSRLVDMPIAGAILLLRPLFGASLAEQGAMLLVPALTLGATMLLVMRLAWVWLGRREAMLAGLMLATAIPLLMQLQPRRIDHHGWQVVCLLLAVNGLTARRPYAGAWLAGLAMAAALTISIEELPMAAVFAGLGAWRWLAGERHVGWLARYMGGLALGALGLFLATRGLADLVTHCDEISPVHLAMFGFCAMVLAPLAGFGKRLPLAARFGILAVLGAGALGIYGGFAPQCRQGIFAQLPAPVYHYWYQKILEGLPLWRQEPRTQVEAILPALFGFYAIATLVLRARGAERQRWLEYGLLWLGTLAVAVLVERASASLIALTLVPLSASIARWSAIVRQRPSALRRFAAALAILLAIEPGVALSAYEAVRPRLLPARPLPVAALTHGVDACQLRQSAAPLARLPHGRVLAELDIAPELLVFTPHAMLASGHHRGARAMAEVITAFTGGDAVAHAIVARERIDYVALCPGVDEGASYTQGAPQGFAAHLLAGRAPGWLVAVPGDARLAVWKVVRKD